MSDNREFRGHWAIRKQLKVSYSKLKRDKEKGKRQREEIVKETKSKWGDKRKEERRGIQERGSQVW